MHPVIACFDIAWGTCQAGIGVFVFIEAFAMASRMHPRWVPVLVGVAGLLLVATSPLLYYVDSQRHTGIEAKP